MASKNVFERRAAILTLCVFTLGMSGCSQESDKSTNASTPIQGGIAVIDLNLIAKEMGRDTQIVEKVKVFEINMNRQLIELQANARKQFDDRKSQMAAAPATTQEEDQVRQAELKQFEQQLNTHLARVQAEARQKTIAFRQSLINAFRAQVRPIAREAATELGATTVMIKQDFVLSVDPAVDITEKVAARLATRSATAEETSVKR